MGHPGNPLLDQVSDSLVGILHRFNLFSERVDCLLSERWSLLHGKVIVDFLHNLHRNGRQDFQEIVVLEEVLEQDVNVFLQLCCKIDMSERSKTITTKIITVVFGLVSFGIVFMVAYLPGVLHASIR